MKPHFTPGPWRVDGTWVKPDNEQVRRRLIADCAVTHGLGEAGEEDKANARLIKESPNMYEALCYIVSLSDGWDDEGSTGPKKPLSWESVGRIALDIARACVAKVEE